MTEVATASLTDIHDSPVEVPESAVPDMPIMSIQEANERLKVLAKATRPPIDEHQAKVTALNEEIRLLKEKTEVLRRQMDEAKQAQVGGKSEWADARALLNKLKIEKEAYKQALDALKAERTVAKDKFDSLKSKKRAMQSEIKHSSIAEVDEAIRKLERRQQTVSMSLQEEKKLLKEIQSLKDSKSVVSQLGGQEELTRSAMDKHDQLRKVESDKWTEFKEANEKYKAQMEVLDKLKAQQDAIADPIRILMAEKKALHDQIGAKMIAKNELLKEFKEANETYGKGLREMRQLRELIKKIEYDTRRAAILERKRLIEEEEAKMIPYEEEMVLCDQLASYLTLSFKQKSLLKEEIVPCTHADQCAPEKDLFEGKSLVIKKREESDLFAGTGGGKKGKSSRRFSADSSSGSRRGSASGSKGEIISHGISTLDSFAMLGLKAPGSRSEVEASIEALLAKKEWYSNQPRGSVPKVGGDRRSNTDNSNKKGLNSAPNGSTKGTAKAPEITEDAFPLLPGTALKAQASVSASEVGAEIADETIMDESEMADQAAAEAEAAQILALKEMEEAAKDAAKEIEDHQAADLLTDVNNSIEDVNEDMSENVNDDFNGDINDDVSDEHKSPTSKH